MLPNGDILKTYFVKLNPIRYLAVHQSISAIKYKPSSAIPLAINTDSKIITSPKQICKEMNKHFVKIGEKLSSNIICISSNKR